LSKMTDQAWAFMFTLLGCAMTVVCKHYGLTDAIGAGIVGGGLTALTKSENKQALPVHIVPVGVAGSLAQPLSTTGGDQPRAIVQ
jgi:hypothetical protein